MNVQQRIDLLAQLGAYMTSENEAWQKTKKEAESQNPWFKPEFIDEAVKTISSEYLDKNKLEKWAQQYDIPSVQPHPKTVGVVMAGNIPLVGFHDFLCVFISGHRIRIKPSSKDERLISHLIGKLYEWENETQNYITIEDKIQNCDAYIATGSNNSGRYFEYYFSKYPNIIRRNRTSVAWLDGTESAEQLALLAKDIQIYFGLGCRNVTKLYVPEDYDFIPLLSALHQYDHFLDFHKYKHNFDYRLAILMINRKHYMVGGSVILSENTELFSPISQINYEYYSDKNKKNELIHHAEIQCIVSKEDIPFGQSQHPGLSDFADGIDTLRFLLAL